MTDKEKRELKDDVISIFKRFNILDHTNTIGGLRNDILRYIDSLQEESPTVYVITRCEEHSDYVEKVFLDYNKAVDYCGQFEGKEDEYGRDITKIEVTL